MSTLKEIEGRYFKECKVVMLPTEDGIVLNTKCEPNGKGHIYITSDDEIKKGDWYIWMTNDSRMKPYQLKEKNITFEKGYRKKIIATTDKSLTYNHSEIREVQAVRMEGRTLKSLPQPSHNFIKVYCEQGGIDKVLVEYRNSLFKGEIVDNSYPKEMLIYYPKTDSHNTITIKPVKDSWSREEVLLLCKNLALSIESKSDYDDINIDSWIKENL